METPLSILQKYWGHQVFRPMQEEIINALLEKNNIGPVSMHLEKQRNVITEIDRKASFVFILSDSFHTLSDQFFKEINTISSRPMKILGK